MILSCNLWNKSGKVQFGFEFSDLECRLRHRKRREGEGEAWQSWVFKKYVNHTAFIGKVNMRDIAVELHCTWYVIKTTTPGRRDMTNILNFIIHGPTSFKVAEFVICGNLHYCVYEISDKYILWHILEKLNFDFNSMVPRLLWGDPCQEKTWSMDEMWISTQCGLPHNFVEGYMLVALSSDYSCHGVLFCSERFLNPSALMILVPGLFHDRCKYPKHVFAEPWSQTVACIYSKMKCRLLFKKGTLSWHPLPAWVLFL